MTVPSATKQSALRVDRLLRSLVGVVDVRLTWDAGGALLGVHVAKAGGVRDDQLVRNVVSGLKAGLGIRATPAMVHIHGTLDSLAAAGPAAAPAAAADAPAQKPAPAVGAAAVAQPGNGAAKPADAAPRANGNGHSSGSNGNGGNGHGKKPAVHGIQRPVGAAPTSEAMQVPPDAGFPLKQRPGSAEVVTVQAAGDGASVPGMPKLERIELERLGAVLRCRITLSGDTSRYSAIAEAPERTGAEPDLAARVTLDALRAGGFTAARLEGLSRTSVGPARFMVAALRAPAAPDPVAGVVALGACPIRAAAEAVIVAAGCAPAERRTGPGH